MAEPDTTAPDAINQADDIVTIDEIRAIFSSGTVPMEAAVAIQNATSPAALRAELREIAAAHRRLAAHGAGEGLREAANIREPVQVVNHVRQEHGTEEWCEVIAPSRPHNKQVAHCADQEDADLIAYLINALLTPPTDAGSTTREGGEGVREALAWYGEQARLARLVHSGGDAGRHALAEDGGKRAASALATTSSPDASPDSGEGDTFDQGWKACIAAIGRLGHLPPEALPDARAAFLRAKPKPDVFGGVGE